MITLKEFQEAENKIEALKSGIPIADYLASLGQHPIRQRGDGQLFYPTFYREVSENKRHKLSFSVSQKLNRWADLGTGDKGSIVDLVMLLDSCNIGEAIKTLIRFIGGDTTQYIPQIPTMAETKGIVLLSNVKFLYHTALLDYMAKRGISQEVAQRYCKLVYFKFDPSQKDMFAVGFENVSGGYALRNGSECGKLCIPPNDVSIIPHPYKTSLMVFEGFTSFLSFVQIYGNPVMSVMVLNSVNNRNREHAIKAFSDASKVYLFLDNDIAGETATNEIMARYNGKCVDMRHTFAPYNDFNDYLLGNGNKKV